MTDSLRLLYDAQISEKIVALVAGARERYGIPEATSATSACQSLGLTLRRTQLPSGTYGLLDEARGAVVVSSDVDLASRFDFTIYHEIMHYLLLEDGELFEYLHEIHHSNGQNFHATLERWCNEGAAEFMVPRNQVRASIAQHGFSVDLVEQIARNSGASIQASSIQLAVCAPVDCYVVLCTYGATPGWPHTPALYVELSTKRDGGTFPLARGTRIPPEHLFHHVWDTKEPTSGSSYIPFRSRKTYPCDYAEAKMVGSRVAGILFLGRPPRKGQLELKLFP